MEKSPEHTPTDVFPVDSKDGGTGGGLENLINISPSTTLSMDSSDVLMSGGILSVVSSESDIVNKIDSSGRLEDFVQLSSVSNVTKEPKENSLNTVCSDTLTSVSLDLPVNMNTVETTVENSTDATVLAGEPIIHSSVYVPNSVHSTASIMPIYIPTSSGTLELVGVRDVSSIVTNGASVSNVTAINNDTIELLQSVPVSVSETAATAVHPSLTTNVSAPDVEGNQQKVDSGSALLAVQDNYVFLETSKGLVLSAVGDNGQITSATSDEQRRQIITQSLPTALFNQLPALGLVEGQEQGQGVYGSRSDGVAVRASSEALFDEADPVSGTTDLQLIPSGALVTTDSGEQPRRKKGGGWPKGKKRKIVPEVNAPKKPATGYVLFAVERRQQIKMMHPELPFAEVTKVLGQEWSCLPPDRKQQYLELADEDKKRYISEMNTFQQSEVYQNLIKKKKMNAAENGRCVGGDTGLDSLIDLEDGINDLYCKVCNVYFISVHNKKEHMFGQQHLQAITTEIQKEIQEQLDQNQQALAEASILPPDQNNCLQEHSNNQTDRLSGPVDVDGFIQGFLQRNYDREIEIKQLRRCFKRCQEDNITMCKQMKELQEYETKLEQELGTLKAYGSSLSAQSDTLKMVPTLFGVINF